MKHELKCWPEYYSAVLNGTKTFEVRINDRGYAVGDILRLREYVGFDDRAGPHYTGRVIEVVVTYILQGESWALVDRMVVMAVKFTEETKLLMQKDSSTDPNYHARMARARAAQHWIIIGLSDGIPVESALVDTDGITPALEAMTARGCTNFKIERT